MRRIKKALFIILGLVTVAIITGTASRSDKKETIISAELKNDPSDLKYVPGLFGAVSPNGKVSADDTSYKEGIFGSVKRSGK